MSKHVKRRKCNNVCKTNNIIKKYVNKYVFIQYPERCKQSMDYKFPSESEVRVSSMIHPLSLTSSNNLKFYPINYFCSLKFAK